MPISLNTNTDTAAVIKNLEVTQRGLSSNIQRLSSGLRITKAGDDAAGLAISESLKAVIRGLQQAQRNGLDGISMTQVAEGAMNQIHAALTRMRELAVQSASDTQDSTTRGYLNDEFAQLKTEINRIADSADFNGRKLINSSSELRFWVGTFACAAENSITVTVADVNTTAIGSSSMRLASATISHASGTVSGALAAISVLDKAISDVSGSRSRIGSAQNRLTFAIDNLASARENLLAANSRIRDVDVAIETSDFTRNQILSQAGVSVLAQANNLPSVALGLLR